MSSAAKVVLGLLVGLVALGLWLHVVGFQETVAALLAVSPLPAALATLAWIAAIILRGWKWHRILLSAQRLRFAVSGPVYWVCAFLNLLFPFRVGELARSLFLKRAAGTPIAVSLPTVLVDRLYSIAVILLGLLFLPLTSFRLTTTPDAEAAHPAMTGLRWGIGLVAAGFFAALALLFVLRNQKARLLGLAQRVLFFVPVAAKERVLGFLDTTVESMQFVRSDRRTVARLLALSLAVLAVDALKDHLVFRAFGLHIPLVNCFLGVCITNLAFILPSPPGSIGSSEWYATLVYSAGFGYSSAQVAGGAIFGHAMATLVVAGAGALSLSSLGLTLTEGFRISDARAQE